jgi:hypothetical protein
MFNKELGNGFTAVNGGVMVTVLTYIKTPVLVKPLSYMMTFSKLGIFRISPTLFARFKPHCTNGLKLKRFAGKNDALSKSYFTSFFENFITMRLLYT